MIQRYRCSMSSDLTWITSSIICPTRLGDSSSLVSQMDVILTLVKSYFHLRETETGAEFSTCYQGFPDVQVSYADFLKKAIAHDENMLALENAGMDMSAKADIDSEHSDAEETHEDNGEVMQGDEGERMESLDDLYHIGPQEIRLQDLDITLGLDIRTQETSSACLSESDEAKSLSFGGFNFWSMGMEELNTMFTILQDPSSFHPSFVDIGLDPNFPQPQHGTLHR
ncbi:hypothetical protein BDR05DRAFT_953956 [Suillus weaverae]|nr:hypothetical protein BDR05DRAFT_953956 [Suillus weaverae]